MKRPLPHALVLLALAGAVHAQSSAHVLMDRDREGMHPGDPLVVVGIASDGNDFRARTPALTKSDKAVVMVDEELNYHRRLSMYEERATYSSAPATIRPWSFGAGPRDGNPDLPGVDADVEGVTEEGGGGLGWFLASILVLAAAVGWFVRRGRVREG